MDPVTQCPDCGAQLVVNVRGHRKFTCGREDVCVSNADGVSATIVHLVQPCRTTEIAESLGGTARPSDLIHDGRGWRARGGLVYFDV